MSTCSEGNRISSLSLTGTSYEQATNPPEGRLQSRLMRSRAYQQKHEQALDFVGARIVNLLLHHRLHKIAQLYFKVFGRADRVVPSGI